MRKARLILNWQCGRSCPLCCNDYETIMSGKTPISDLAVFANYDEVMLTGGDPLLLGRSALLFVVGQLRDLRVKRIYLYTTWWTPSGEAALPFIDGVHFSLHPSAGDWELKLLAEVEAAAKKYPQKSFRLFVDKVLPMPTIDRSAWSRVEWKEFMTEQQLIDLQPQGLPEGEALYVYLPTAKTENWIKETQCSK